MILVRGAGTGCFIRLINLFCLYIIFNNSDFDKFSIEIYLSLDKFSGTLFILYISDFSLSHFGFFKIFKFSETLHRLNTYPIYKH